LRSLVGRIALASCFDPIARPALTSDPPIRGLKKVHRLDQAIARTWSN
jgi:hypothetical protein